MWLCDAGHDCPEHQRCGYSIFLITLCVARGQTVRAGTGRPLPSSQRQAATQNTNKKYFSSQIVCKNYRRIFMGKIVFLFTNKLILMPTRAGDEDARSLHIY